MRMAKESEEYTSSAILQSTEQQQGTLQFFVHFSFQWYK